MKHILLNLTLLVTLIATPLICAGAERPLSGNTGVIDYLDKKGYIMVIDDRRVSVDKDVKVHSEFVTQDYFSRLKKGMKIKFKQENINGKPYITEIWVQ